jgi:hypothetical protein
MSEIALGWRRACDGVRVTRYEHDGVGLTRHE